MILAGPLLARSPPAKRGKIPAARTTESTAPAPSPGSVRGVRTEPAKAADILKFTYLFDTLRLYSRLNTPACLTGPTRLIATHPELRASTKQPTMLRFWKTALVDRICAPCAKLTVSVPRMSLACLAALAALAFAEPTAAVAQDAKPAKTDAQHEAYFRGTVAPFLTRYCADCHSGDDAMAGVQVDLFTKARDVQDHRKTWERILVMLQTGLMPPEDSARPKLADVDPIVDWVQERLTNIDCSGPRVAGRVTIRRLNRAEYNNTIRDLVGLDFEPAADFPADDVGYGFDNIGDVLTLPPILFEKYLDAAEQIVNRAITTPEDRQAVKTQLDVDDLSGGSLRNSLRVLVSSGEVSSDFQFSHEADYVIRIEAAGDQAGDEPAKMRLKLGRRAIKVVEVPAVRRDPKTYEVRFKAPQGKHRLAVEFINDFYNPKDPDPNNRDRNLYVGSWEIEGPLDLPPVEPSEAHKRIIFVTPDAKRSPARCARVIITRFADQAWRRPAAPEEVDRLMQLFDKGNQAGLSFESSLKLPLQAVLVSPHFLFRVEKDPPPGETRPLSEHELATRLSYFLWSSMPDEELRKLADAGKLRTNLESQVRRMLRDPKAWALVENFADQWLQIRNLDTISIDRRQYRAWGRQLKEAMRQESRLYFEYIMREDRSLFELLDSNYTFVNETLAKHYGIEGVEGEEFQKVTLNDRRRGGVLTQASVLTITSNPTRTSPVKRGKWIMEQILGTEPPPPPPDVPELTSDGPLVGTLREQMEQHRANPNCAVCHVQMDALGFAFENFDPIGGWREKDGKHPIDASGELPGGKAFDGPGALKAILKGDADAFRRSFAEKMLTYALGRGLEHEDNCTIEDLRAAMAAGGDRFSSLVLAIVKSEPFQKRDGRPGTRPGRPPSRSSR